jgi:hypothetical protein
MGTVSIVMNQTWAQKMEKSLKGLVLAMGMALYDA